MDHLVDAFGRPLRDLRISVTDRCNFRCTYCMPKEVFGHDYRFLDRRELLDFEEITRVARAAVELGVTKLRITGGEPLIRRDVEELIAMLARLPVEVTLTTNASLLPRKAQPLADAGLARITVSLDAMDDATFRRMNDVDFPVERVVEMARFFRGTGHILRFIEFMDVGATNGWRMDDVVPAAEIVARIAKAFPLEPAGPNYRGEVAKRWRYADGAGEIGIIASVTQPFCGDCTRSRLSAEGKLYTCLFAVRGHDLRALLRGGATDEELAAKLAEIWRVRGDRYSELRSQATVDPAIGGRKVEMSYIGG